MLLRVLSVCVSLTSSCMFQADYFQNGGLLGRVGSSTSLNCLFRADWSKCSFPFLKIGCSNLSPISVLAIIYHGASMQGAFISTRQHISGSKPSQAVKISVKTVIAFLHIEPL